MAYTILINKFNKFAVIDGFGTLLHIQLFIYFHKSVDTFFFFLDW